MTPNPSPWRRSSRCGEQSACVLVADINGQVGVRDSKDPDGPVLLFAPAEWLSFLAAAKAGEFDLPDDSAAPTLPEEPADGTALHWPEDAVRPEVDW